MSKPVLVKTNDSKLDRNFEAISQSFSEGRPVITEPILLKIGDNKIKPPAGAKKPKGRVTVYQSEAADLTDGGLDSNGYWTLSSTAVTTVRLWFV